MIGFDCVTQHSWNWVNSLG